MPGCASYNCTNSSAKGFRLFKFPADPERKKKWIINCRRDKWYPTEHSKLCEVHFEQSQFESHRADNKKKLKQNAVPTLFDVPNPPPNAAGQKGVRLQKSESVLEHNHVDENIPDADRETLLNENDALKKRLKELETELKDMKARYLALQSKMSSFLTEEQIKFLGENPQSIPNWSKDALVKGLKLRFALGKHGYEYLRSTGYPSPSYSTLNRRTSSLKFDPCSIQHILRTI